MRNNDTITFEIGRNDLEVVLGNRSLTIAKMEKTQEALKGVVEVIRTALWEDEDPGDEPDCENCDLPCRQNLHFNGNTADAPDIEDKEILEDAAEQKLKEVSGIAPSDSGNDEVSDDEDEAESLAIELLKAVFSVLTDVSENGE